MIEKIHYTVANHTLPLGEAALETLFATRPYISRRDLAAALDFTLSNHRLSDLLSQLVAEGRLKRKGTGNKTRYRKRG